MPLSSTDTRGVAGHLMVAVVPEQVAEFERDYAVGQRVNLGGDDRGGVWIRVTELRRRGERAGEVEYLLAFAACHPPAPPN
jgi:hypothetical protein